MKKIFSILFIFSILSCVVLADDDGIWDNYGDINFYNNTKQTAVSDENFDKTLEKVKEKKKKGFKLFSREKKTFKGDNLQQSNETEILKGIETETPVLTVACPLKKLNGEILPTGHYQVKVEKLNDKLTMKFYQSHYIIAEYPAVETDEDLFDEYINYLTMDDFDETHIKINFGSLDFNAYVIIEKAM